MHNLKGRQPAQLDTFSGTVTLADPTSLPEGASARNQNMDFNVGGTTTRKGLLNPFTYQNSSAGPVPGQTAVNVDLSGSTWNNPANVLLNNGSFATTDLGGAGSTVNFVPSSISQTSDGMAPEVTWANPQNITDPTLFATVPIVAGNPSLLIGGPVSGPAIPIGQTITGVDLFVSAIGDSTCTVQLNIYLSGNLAAQSAQIPITGSPQLYNSGELTGTGITADDLNAGRVTVTVQAFTSAGPVTVSANDLQIEVFYTAAASDGINVQEFGLSVPSSATPQGFQIAVLGYALAPATVSVQMLKAGVLVGQPRSIALPVGAPATVPLGGINDLFGSDWLYSDLNSTTFGLQLTVVGSSATEAFLGFTTLTAYFAPIAENFNYVATFEDSFATIRTLALDASGQWWVENVSTNPGVLMPLFGGPPANSYAVSFTTDSRQYIAISNLTQGNYPPQQYTGQWNDRVSQVGPGAPPIFAGVVASGTTFDIESITQPAIQLSTGNNTNHFDAILQSNGPGSTTPGNVVTVYTRLTENDPQDPVLAAAMASGIPVYVYISNVTGTFIPGTYQVTSISTGIPPGGGGTRWTFTYNVNSIQYQQQGHVLGNYQISLATLTTAAPVPGLTVGSRITVNDVTPAAWNNVWSIVQTLNSGAFNITETRVSGGVATYSYALTGLGTPPVAGQLVTITGTNNANGALNLVNATIATASGGSSGTFTIAVSAADFPAAAEEGQGTTAGTIFTFDPGAALDGTTGDPIFGNAGAGGTLTFAGNGQFIGVGTRKGVVFGITRNGMWTRPSPPVTFDIADNTGAIQATNIPIGPPDWVARGIAFTEGGANGVPGANFFTLPQPVQFIVEGVTYTASSLFINDNTTTSATFSFPDTELLQSEAIDIEGNDLFNLGELGDSAWCTQYAGRTVWGRVRNKIQNFLNLTFDGGYLANPGGNLLPLGWSLNAATAPTGGLPTLLVSPVFGNSYYINNQTGSTQAVLDMIYQSAYQDWNLVPILQNQTAYSVRVTCRTPGSGTAGALVVDLTDFNTGTGFGKTYGTFTLPLSSMTSTMTTYQGTLLTDETLNITAEMQLRAYAANLTNGEDLEIDCIEIFPTLAPTNLTGLTFSYLNDPESFDLVTGGNDTSVVNAQPANGAFEIHDQLYVVKESSLCYLKDTPNQEPANWNPAQEVSNVAGACGINAFDVGEEWAVMACQNGLFLFNGGAPVPIQIEIPDIWKAINWTAGASIVVRNDVAERKIYIAVPLATPNPWMVDETVNSNPQTPNVVIALDYKGIGTIEELMEAMSMHVTMTGKLAIHDMRRKWSLWTIPTPYIGLVKRDELTSTMMFCNGIQSSNIYTLTGPKGVDDGADFTSSYCCYGFVDADKAAEMPMFGLYNKRYVGYDALIEGEGNVQPIFYQNSLSARYPFSTPGGIDLEYPQTNDVQNPLDEYAQRLFPEFVMEHGWFNLSRLTLAGAADRWAPWRGK